MRFGTLSIDTDAHEVHLDDRAVPLTPIEYGLLVELARRPRVVRSPRELYESVWDSPWLGDDHVVETHMSRLRRKLGERAEQPRFLRTIRGIGYRFEIAAQSPERLRVHRPSPLVCEQHGQLISEVEVTIDLDPAGAARGLEARLCTPGDAA